MRKGRFFSDRKLGGGARVARLRRGLCSLCASAFAFLFALNEAQAVAVALRPSTPAPVATEVEFMVAAQGVGEISFEWDFGDGETFGPSPLTTVNHEYAAPGHYPVIVRARDETGARTTSLVQTVHAPLVGEAPHSSTICLSQDEKRVCVVNVDSDSVTCLSTETGKIAWEKASSGKPRSLQFDAEGILWVAHEEPALILGLDEEGEEVARIALSQGSRPMGIVVDPKGARAWVSLQGLGQVVEVDLTEQVVRRALGVSRMPTGLGLSPDGKSLYVTHFISPDTAGIVTRLSTEGLHFSGVLPLAIDKHTDSDANGRGLPNYLREIAISPDGLSAWVPSKKDNIERGMARDGLGLTFETSVRAIVSFLDLKEGRERVERRVDLNNRGLSLSAAFSPLGDYVFVATMGTNTIEVLDSYDGKLVAGLQGVGLAPDGLVVTKEGQVFLHGFLSRSVIRVDASALLRNEAFALSVQEEIPVVSEEKLSASVLRGKRLFYDSEDTRLAKDGYISCAACHFDGFEDGRVWDFTDRGEGLRNTTSLLGRAGTGHGPVHWSANFDEIQDFEHDIRGPFGGTGLLADEDFASGTHNQTLGDEKEGLSEDLDALAEYVSSLTEIHPSPHRAEDGLLTEDAVQGKELFLELGCAECHAGEKYTDSKAGVRHNVGTITELSGQRLGGELDGIDTPTLLGIWETAPYLHDGSAPTLGEVFTAKNPQDKHGITSGLSPIELGQLVAYLLQIDGREELPTEVAETPESAPAEADPGGGGCQLHPMSVPKGGRDLMILVSLLGAGAYRRRRQRAG